MRIRWPRRKMPIATDSGLRRYAVFSFVVQCNDENTLQRFARCPLTSAHEIASRLAHTDLIHTKRLKTMEKGVMLPYVDATFFASFQKMAEVQTVIESADNVNAADKKITVEKELVLAIYEEIQMVDPKRDKIDTPIDQDDPIGELRDGKGISANNNVKRRSIRSRSKSKKETGYILLAFKTMEHMDNREFVSNWKTWTGVRFICMQLPRQLGLRRISFYRRLSNTCSFSYVLVIEISNLLLYAAQVLNLMDRIKLRLCGYVGIYREVDFEVDELTRRLLNCGIGTNTTAKPLINIIDEEDPEEATKQQLQEEMHNNNNNESMRKPGGIQLNANAESLFKTTQNVGFPMSRDPFLTPKHRPSLDSQDDPPNNYSFRILKNDSPPLPPSIDSSVNETVTNNQLLSLNTSAMDLETQFQLQQQFSPDYLDYDDNGNDRSCFIQIPSLYDNSFSHPPAASEPMRCFVSNNNAPVRRGSFNMNVFCFAQQNFSPPLADDMLFEECNSAENPMFEDYSIPTTQADDQLPYSVVADKENMKYACDDNANIASPTIHEAVIQRATESTVAYAVAQKTYVCGDWNQSRSYSIDQSNMLPTTRGNAQLSFDAVRGKQTSVVHSEETQVVFDYGYDATVTSSSKAQNAKIRKMREFDRNIAAVIESMRQMSSAVLHSAEGGQTQGHYDYREHLPQHLQSQLSPRHLNLKQQQPETNEQSRNRYGSLGAETLSKKYKGLHKFSKRIRHHNIERSEEVRPPSLRRMLPEIPNCPAFVQQQQKASKSESSKESGAVEETIDKSSPGISQAHDDASKEPTTQTNSGYKSLPRPCLK